MGPLSSLGEGSIIWSHPVNLTFIEKNWSKIFDVYIKNGTYEDHKIKQEVKYFNFTGQNENQTVMNFQVTFFDPTVFAIKHL